MRTIITFIILSIILESILSCNINNNIIKQNAKLLELQEQNSKKKLDSLTRQKEFYIRSSLYKKEITSIKNLIKESNSYTNVIILICSSNDCTSCIECGFKIINEIHNNSKYQTYAISISDKLHFDTDLYKKVIYEDSSGELHKEINFAPTPLILVLENYKIKDIHKPSDCTLDISEEFIKKYS